MFIQTEETPNPLCLKFLPGRVVLDHGTLQFSRDDETVNSPLARRLLTIDGIDSILFGSDFISATKSVAADWYVLKPHILGAIMEHFITNKPILDSADAPADVVALNPTNDPVIAEILEILDTRVRPAVAQDGGDITFERFENGVVYLRLQGACSGCPSSTATLKDGIENMLRHYVPEVLEVRAAN